MINKIYRGILDYAGFDVDEEGFISIMRKNKKCPVEINGLNLVIPEKKQLQNFDSSNKLCFHLLAENILLKKDDPVMVRFKKNLNIKINYTTGVILHSLLNIIINTNLHKELNQDQVDLLLDMPEADSKSLENLIKLTLSSMKVDPEKVFINSYIKRGGKVGNDKFNRVSVIQFPFFEKLEKMNLRKKDIKVFEKLLKFVFPNLDATEEYNYGSRSRVAPHLDSVMTGSLSIVSCLNSLLMTYKEFIEDYEKLLFNSDWVDQFSNLDNLHKEIRMIPSTPVPGSLSEPVVQNPINNSTGEIPYPENIPNNPPPVGYNNPPPVPGGQYNQPNQEQGVTKTERGVNFKSILRTNPGLVSNGRNNQIPPPSLYPGQGYPPNNQQPQVDQWGRPLQQQVDQWGRPIAGNGSMDLYPKNDNRAWPPRGVDPHQQQRVDQWGRPLQQQQQPQFDQWNRPIRY